MPENNRNIIGIIFIVMAVVIALALTTSDFFVISPFAIVGESFTPIFCNDYEFTCCNEHVQYTTSIIEVTDEISYVCPSNAYRCEIISHLPLYGWYSGSKNCDMKRLLYGDYWWCDDARGGFKANLNPNEHIWVLGTPKTWNIKGTIQVRVYKLRLDFCGRAGCRVGVPVLGADQCHFNPEKGKVYDSNTGRVTTAVSYTVPTDQCTLSFQRGSRHICGYKEESCDRDVDCGGHTFGQFECYGKTLQKYGCVGFGIPVDLEQDRLPWEAGWNTESEQVLFGKRCEVVETTGVQCCGDFDCGLDYFCDVGDTWTCKEKVECRWDVDCGTKIICDWTEKIVKKPVCRFGKCGWQILQSVDCCSDVNCPSGYYCTADYKCRERTVVKNPCPYECCVKEELYFDKACPPDKPYCVDNACQKEFTPDKYCDNCDEFAVSYIIGGVWKAKACNPKILQNPTTCFFSFIKFGLVLLVFIFALLFGSELLGEIKSIEKSKPAIWIISSIIALILAYLTFVLFWIGVIAVILLIAYVLIKKIVLKK